MELREVTSLLSEQGIRLSADGGRLSAKKDIGSISPGLQSLIREREQDLLDWLKRKEPVVHEFPPLTGKEFPALAAQKALWFAQKSARPHYLHHAQVKIHLEAQVNLPLLVRSLNKLIARRESLRTLLKNTGTGEVMQVVRAPFAVDIPLVTVGKSGVASISENLEHIAKEHAQSRYDLARGPLFRVSVLQFSDRGAGKSVDRQIILFSFHRLILDDRSWGFLLQEWLALYNTFTGDALLPLRVVSVDYADYNIWRPLPWKQKPELQIKRRPVTSLVSLEERHKVVEEWNRTEVAFLETHCVQHLFEEQVSKTPNAVAICYDDQEVNYFELNRLSNQLAHYLIDLGVKPDVRVGLCVEPSLDMLVGLLGILKAGGAYVPLDVADGKERLACRIKYADIKTLLTLSGLKGFLPEQGPQNLYLDTNTEWVGGAWANKNPITPIEPEHMAYALYSQSAAADDIAVVMPHRALVNLIQWQVGVSRCTTGSKTLLLNPITCGMGFQEIFATWCSGGSLVLAPKKRSGNYASLWRFILQEKIERIFLGASTLQSICEAREVVSDDSDKFMAQEALREVIAGGAPLAISPQIKSFFSRLSKCKLMGQYSRPELQVAASYLFEAPIKKWQDVPIVGRPIANGKIYILDKLLRPVPVGAVGDLYVGGAGLAQGYLGRVSLTEARFVTSPFAKDSNEYLYKTGDKAKFLPDGSVELAG
ncbi:AMP-binding protein [Exilibacterium tricleocarpae]|nr:AMP-binding protein [Exilibacterium tricleocarpae]